MDFDFKKYFKKKKKYILCVKQFIEIEIEVCNKQVFNKHKKNKTVNKQKNMKPNQISKINNRKFL